MIHACKITKRCTATYFAIASLMLGLVSTSIMADEAPASTAKCKILLIIGSPGAAEFGNQFEAWADDWRTIAKQAEADLIEVGGTSQEGSNDRETLRDLLAEQALANDTNPLQPLWLVFIGHGTYQAGIAKFNLRGPDVAADELKGWLQPMKRPLVIVNVASASGPFVNALSGENRIVVTATKSGEEQNFARFGAYLPKALLDARADLDHDDEVSLLEAVLKASVDTEDFYASDDRIRTEHAIIDDNGDQRGTPAEMLKSVVLGSYTESESAKPSSLLDGAAAAKTILVPSTTATPLTQEETAERTRIEAEIEEIRAKKSSLAEQDYYKQLGEKMLKLSRIYDAAEKRAKLPASSP